MEGVFMRKFVYLLLCAGVCGSICQRIYSQGPGGNLTHDQIVRRDEVRRGEELERRESNLQLLEKMSKAKKESDPQSERAPVIDRETLEKIRSFRQIDPAEKTKYTSFLSSERTGILRFFPDTDCMSKDYLRIG